MTSKVQMDMWHFNDSNASMKRASSAKCQACQLTLLSKDCLQCRVQRCHESLQFLFLDDFSTLDTPLMDPEEKKNVA